MTTPYQDGRIRRLYEQLEKAGLPEGTVVRIMKGGEVVRAKDKPTQKAVWLKGAMERMELELAPELRKRVREGCACCVGGKRHEVSKAIARDHATLEERIAAANEERFVFGHSVRRLDDGRIEVRFAPDALERYECPCLRGLKEPMPIAYCECCGGHVKHHLQTALGVKLECTVEHTALSTAGKRACTFTFELR